MKLTIHVPSALAGLGFAVLVGALMAQQLVGSPALDVVRIQQPTKVLGIPAPDEWIDIESNAVGQPATTYTVPAGHRLTLVSYFSTPTVTDTDGAEWIDAVVSIDGVRLNRDTIAFGWDAWETHTHVLRDVDDAARQHPAFLEGTVLHPGQVLTVDRIDPGDSTNLVYAADTATYTVRGFLEKVE